MGDCFRLDILGVLFRLIVFRRPYQSNLFGDEDKKLSYSAIAATMDGKAQEVLQWYNQRGECSENRIKDLKCPEHNLT